MMDNLKKLFGNVPLEMPYEYVHVPIWYVFKNGNKIDLNNPCLIIEDWSGKYSRLRQLGQIKIKAWEKLNQVLPMSKKLAVPEVVFYQ